MFEHPDRYLVALTVEFNVTAISEWFKTRKSIEDVEGMEASWEDCTKQRYDVDIVPCGKSTDFYFHRKAGAISNNIGGIDFFGRVNPEIKRMAEYYDISHLGWSMWRNCLKLEANNELIALIPLDEVLELQMKRRLTNSKSNFASLGTLIDVPTRFEDNTPKEFIKIMRHVGFSSSVSYNNALGRVSANADYTFEVQY